MKAIDQLSVLHAAMEHQHLTAFPSPGTVVNTTYFNVIRSYAS